MHVHVELDGLDRPAWLEARRAGIGSSDAPAICGLDRFRSPFVVYLDKRGEIGDEPDNEAMAWGRLLEDPIAQRFSEVTGLVVSKPTAMFRHDDHEFMLASPDRHLSIVAEEPPVATLEVKTSALRDDWKDGPPERTLVQLQHQLAVTGEDHGYVACLVNGRNYEHWRVERDDELIAALVEIEARFWQRILDGVPPEIDGHRSTTAALHELYAESRAGATVVLPDEAEALLISLHMAKAAVKEAEADEALYTNQIKALMGDHEIGLLGDRIAVTWKPTAATKRHNCPDCVHVKDGPSRQFLPKKVDAA